MALKSILIWMSFLAALQTIILPIVGRVLRLQCQMFADFNIVHRGRWLQGSKIAEFRNTGIQECYFHCLQSPSCKSFNLEKDDYGICQLNAASSDDVLDNVNLTANESWNFHSTNFSDRLVGHNCRQHNPCRKDQICLDTCTCPGYRCLNCTGNPQNIHCNRCASQPCQNGGTCNELNATLCTCRDGYNGEFCQVDINECSSNPCQNGGNCTDLESGYSCNCPAGYNGLNCETGLCTQYIRLDSPTRSIDFVVTPPYDQINCDNNIVHMGWYRFTGDAGTRMHASCPSDIGTVYRCKTHAAGWLNGQHPSIQGVQVERSVCFAWDGNCCYRSVQIQIVACGQYYIYKLPQMQFCYYRYCGSP